MFTANAATAIIVTWCSHYFYPACEGLNVWLLEVTFNAVRLKAAAAICTRLRGGARRGSTLPQLDFLPWPVDPWRICAAFLCYVNLKMRSATNPTSPVQSSAESGKINPDGRVWPDQQLSHLLKVQRDEFRSRKLGAAILLPHVHICSEC